AKALQLGIIPKNDVKNPEQPFAKTLASDVASLVKTFGTGNPPSEADMAIIKRLDIKNIGINDGRRITRLLSLMEIFGYKIPHEIWYGLLKHKNRFDGEVPPAFLIDMLNKAVAENRKAEIILLSSLLANGNDSDKMSDLVLIPVVNALKTSGLAKEARDIAYKAVANYQ
ncbi:MAG: hypothetical protein WCJ33_05420, partial [Pseudomonadota bacterium]